MAGKTLLSAALLMATSATFAAGAEIVFSSQMLSDDVPKSERPEWISFVEPVADVLPENFVVVRERSGLSPLPEDASARFFTMRTPLDETVAPGVYVGLGVGKDRVMRDETGASHAVKLSVGAEREFTENGTAFIEAQTMTGVGMTDMGGMEATVKVGFKIELN